MPLSPDSLWGSARIRSHACVLRKGGFSVSYQRPDKPTSSSCKKKKKKRENKRLGSKSIRTLYLSSVLLLAQVDSNLFLCRTVRVFNSNKDFWQLLGEIRRPNQVKRDDCKGSAFNPSRKGTGTVSECYPCSVLGVYFFLVHVNTVKVWGVDGLERLSAGTEADGKQMQDARKVR